MISYFGFIIDWKSTYCLAVAVKSWKNTKQNDWVMGIYKAL